MPNTPAPLRDALRQAIEALSHEAWVSGWEEGSNDEDVAAARDRVDALLSQIPTDLEAREGETRFGFFAGGTFQPMRCSGCRHWDNTSQREDLARFDALKAAGSWVVEHSTREWEEEKAEFGDCAMLHESDLLNNADHVDQWWRAQQKTHRDFGCVLWAPREGDAA